MSYLELVTECKHGKPEPHWVHPAGFCVEASRVRVEPPEGDWVLAWVGRDGTVKLAEEEYRTDGSHNIITAGEVQGIPEGGPRRSR